MALQEGVCRPPLRGPEDAGLDDPGVLSYRRQLAVATEGHRLCIRRADTGAEVAAFRPKQVWHHEDCLCTESAWWWSGSMVVSRVGCGCVMQRVWVELGADSSRAHGPTLRMRLLEDGHPAAIQVARQAAPAEAKVGRGPGCDDLPRGMLRPYRPPVVGSAPQQQQQQQQPSGSSQSRPSGQQPPPGFEDMAAQHCSPHLDELAPEQQPAALQPATIAEALQHLQEVHQQQVVAAAAGQPSQAVDATDWPPRLLQALLCQLQQRASRAAVRSAGSAPEGPRARERAARAISCREQLQELQQRR